MRNGLYEFEVMPFGLKAALATFCRLMDRIVGDVYFDDILIHSRDSRDIDDLFEKRLRKVLKRLRKVNLTLAMNKCTFLPKNLLYLSFIVGDGKLKPNPEKVKSLNQFRPLKTYEM